MESTRNEPPPSLHQARICLVDAFEVVRAGLRICLESRHGALVKAEASSLEELLPLVRGVDCEIVVTEVAVSGTRTANLVRQFKATVPGVKIVILTALDQPDLVVSLLEAGADGYFLKTGSSAELVRALLDVMAGRTYIHPLVAGSVVTALRSRTSPDGRYPLSHREKEVLAGLVQGWDTTEICRSLCLARNTVKTHLRTLYKKLGVTDRTQAVLTAIREGLA